MPYAPIPYDSITGFERNWRNGYLTDRRIFVGSMRPRHEIHTALFHAAILYGDGRRY